MSAARRLRIAAQGVDLFWMTCAGSAIAGLFDDSARELVAFVELKA